MNTTSTIESLQYQISQLTKRAEADESVKQRLTDLVRYCRSELSGDGLITEEEYTELAGIKGSPARLESYDSLLSQLNALTERNKELEKPTNIRGERLACLVSNCHRLLRHKYKKTSLWVMVSDVTGHGSTYSAQICNEAGFDPHQNCGKEALTKSALTLSTEGGRE